MSDDETIGRIVLTHDGNEWSVSETEGCRSKIDYVMSNRRGLRMTLKVREPLQST